MIRPERFVEAMSYSGAYSGSTRAPALVFVVDHIQNVQRFFDAPELRDGLREPRRMISGLQRAHNAGRGDPSQLK